MSTITAILEPDTEGRVHLLLPSEMRHSKVRVIVIPDATPKPNSTARPLDSLRRIAAGGGLQGITDPVAWQRDIRREKPLLGRSE